MKLDALLRKIEARVPAALEAGCQAVANHAKVRAGSLADQIVVSPVVVSGNVVRCEVTVEPAEGEIPPAVREFGNARNAPKPFMRPAANRGKALVGDELAKAFRSI